MAQLDHIIWGAPDLESAVALFARLTGVTPSAGGSHPGFGTRNRLVGLGDGVYLEILALDPDQEARSPRARQLQALHGPGLITISLRSDDLALVRDRAAAAGLDTPAPTPMGRVRPDGVALNWEILTPVHTGFGDLLPFFIDWGRSPHPSADAASGCRLKSLTALHPDVDALRGFFDAIGVAVPVARSHAEGFIAVLDTPRGDVILTPPPWQA